MILIATLQILAEIEARPFSLKYLGLQLTCSPGFSNLPTASQPISPENDGKWISQKTACIYQLSISLTLFSIKTKNVAHFTHWALKITTILSLPHKNIDPSYYGLGN